MIFRLSKQVLENFLHPELGHVPRTSVYVLRSEDKTLGEFFMGAWGGWINSVEGEWRLTIRRHLFRSSDYLLSDRKTGLEIGYYHFPFLSGSIQPALFLNGIENLLRRRQPGVGFHLFKRETWGHYQLDLERPGSFMTYRFHLNLPWLEGKGRVERPFEGEIETDTPDLKRMLFGSYLVEHLLERENDAG